MRKILVLTLLSLFVTLAFAAPPARAQEKKEKPAAAAKQLRWHGSLVRINKDVSTLNVRKGSLERTIHYDASTRWTKGKKAIEMSELKEGSDIICLGKDEKGEFIATQVDLRR
jgi:Cu/Ag efflux protein CusF